MDPRHATPSVLSSQAYSPPPLPPPAGVGAGVSSSSAPDPYSNEAVLAAINSSAYDTTHSSNNNSSSSSNNNNNNNNKNIKRQPLQESTGNAQHHHPQLPSIPLSSHHHHYPHGQYPLPSTNTTRSCTPTILTPPILPTQTLGSNVHHIPGSGAASSSSSAAAAAAAASSSLRLRRYQHELLRQQKRSHRNRNLNPIYEKPQFQAYRDKHKDRNANVWQDELEHPFLDALLIIPFMGRRKFYMNNKPHGRNMIIGEYVWLRWCATQPPGADLVKVRDEHLPEDQKLSEKDANKYHPMFRRRKQGSSHIQVLKSFFKYSWAFHFFFSKGKEEGSKDKNKQPTPNRWYKINTDQRNFKTNPILCALEAGQLPAERPNYEYFRQLLAMDNKVQIQPSTCWIYIANKHLIDKPSCNNPQGEADSIINTNNKFHHQRLKHEYDDEVRLGGSSSSSSTRINTHHAEKGLLYPEDFPHRYAFNNPPVSDSDNSNSATNNPWLPRESEVHGISQTLLHEYAFESKQTESSCVREVLDEWKEDHPELYRRLEGVIKAHDLENIHALPQSQMCDLLHVDVTLDMHRVRFLPDGSNFEWLLTVDITTPALAGHEWNVRTWLERPAELVRGSSSKSGGGGGRMVKTQEDGIMRNKLTHVRGCGDENPHCDCQARQGGSNTWLLPVPLRAWAESLQMCGKYPRYLKPKDSSSGGGSSSRGGGGRKEDEMPESETVTQMDLMRATAMYQDLWSRAPMMPGALEEPQWTRRAVILWTFNTTDFFDAKGQICHTPAGSSWRWLSAVDPLSVLHQERAILPGNVESESPPPPQTYQPLLNSHHHHHNHHHHQHLADNLSSVWGLSSAGGVHSAPASMPVSPMAPYGPSPVHVHNNFTANGLVTPPASATLPSTYTFEGSGGVVPSNSLSSYLPVTSMGMDPKADFVTGDSFSTGYLQEATGHHGSFYDEAEADNESDTTLNMQGEPADLSSYEPQAWPSLNSSAHWDHHGLQSLSMVAEEMANQASEPGKTAGSFRGAAGSSSSAQAFARYCDSLQLLDGQQTTPRLDANSNSNNNNNSNKRRAPLDQYMRQESASDHVGYGQGSHSTAAWDADLSHLHHQQQHQQHHRDAGLPDYGSTSLGPLLNRKRRRDDDDEGENGRYPLAPMPSYSQRGDVRYAPTAIMDRQDGQGWS